MATPGILYVPMQPGTNLPLEQFHEWYNNEHGPTRLRLPQIFTNGIRYRALDAGDDNAQASDEKPGFLAAYDVTSMPHLETETYTSLRSNRSPREAETIGQCSVKRCFYDLVFAKQSPLFLPLEELTDGEAEGIVLVAVEPKPRRQGADVEAEIHMWYAEEHVNMLSKVPGWLRSRLFKTSTLETKTGAPTSFIALHEYTKDNGVGSSEEYKAATTTPRMGKIFSEFATMASRRVWSLSYVFGPAPRDLQNLSRLAPTSISANFTSLDSRTITISRESTASGGSGAVIKSYVTNVSDGLTIPYRLEGNPDPKAPTVAFCNSLLTSLHMWDHFVSILKRQRPQYRILRYDARGRHTIPTPPVAANLDMLSDDLASILKALRIPKLDTLVGVSMGGATTLNFALRYPEKVEKFVACDFNAISSEANTAAWKERIGVAEDGTEGIRKLAAQTVERWLHPATGTRSPDAVTRMTEMVAANDVQGFKYSCQALWDYDLKTSMRGCKVPGLLVVGEGDGKGALVKAMEGFKGLLGADESGKGAGLAIVPETGHLPMFEDPEAFWRAVEKFL